MRLAIALLAVFGCFVFCCLADDTFHILTCFCHDTFDVIGNREDFTESGSFVEFRYYNEHLDHTYVYNITERITAKSYALDDQKSAVPYLEPTCRIYEDGNELCYWRHHHQSRARVRFNGHKRHLPWMDTRPDYTWRPQAYDECQQHCIRDVGLSDMDEQLTNLMKYELKPICAHGPEGSCFRAGSKGPGIPGY
jgi:hypothetical protein